MNRASRVLVVGVLVLCAGCNESEPGGPGAKTTYNRNPVTLTPKKETFRISAPTTTTILKQGEQKEVNVTVERSSDFKQDVTMTFKGDKGVTVTPETDTVKASSSDTKVKVMIGADKDAPVGEATIHIIAKPESGDSTSADFTVNVKGT
jgi:flagellar basal body rod protein FlgF